MMGGMGGMGGPQSPEQEMQQRSQQSQQDFAAKNSGETEGGADGKTYKWEQTSAGGESEILVRFTLAEAVKAKQVKVTVAGEELLSGKTFGTVSVDESTWFIGEKGTELQVMLALAQDNKWHDLLA